MPIGILHGDQREGIEIVDGIALLLPSVGIQHLTEVALLVEQAEADQRIILVAGRLEMIAGENSQAARIDGQTLGEPVLGGEVGDQFAIGRRRGFEDAGIIGFTRATVKGKVAGVGAGAFQGGLGDAAQHQDGIVAAIAPQGRDRAGGTGSG